jgi:hypothetical protein
VQAARKAAMAIIDALRHDGLNPLGRFRLAAAFQEPIMALLLLEALGALLLLVFIVWWTMFSGREKGELKDESARAAPDPDKEKK